VSGQQQRIGASSISGYFASGEKRVVMNLDGWMEHGMEEEGDLSRRGERDRRTDGRTDGLHAHIGASDNPREEQMGRVVCVKIGNSAKGPSQVRRHHYRRTIETDWCRMPIELMDRVE
jgi:hypothetical protein